MSGNLLAYSLQVALLVAAAGVCAWALKIRDPRISLVYWRGMLAACVALPFVQPWTHEIITAAPPARISGVMAPLAITASAPGARALSAFDAVLIVLVLGFAARLAWTALGLLRLRCYRRRARPLADPPEFVEEYRCALAPEAGILLSGEVRGPVTFGIFRPVVLLPDNFPAQPEPTQRALVCHELLHVSRHDAACTLAEEIVAALLWFHPAVWWVINRIQLACEEAVDRQAVEILSDRKQYLNAVMEAAGIQLPAPGTGFASPFRNQSHLVERVALIAQEIRMSKGRMLASTLASAMLLFAAGVAAVRAFPLKGEPQAQAAGKDRPVRVGPELAARMLVSAPACPAVEAKGGYAVLDVVIGTDGLVKDSPADPNAPPLFLAVFDCLKTWRWEPLMIGGKPVEARMSVTVGKAPPLPPPPPVGGQVVKAAPRAMIAVGEGVPGGVTGGVIGGIVADKPEPELPPAEAGQMRIRVGANVQAKKLISAPDPVYPPLALQARIQGTVKLRIAVSEQGDVKNMSLISGHPLLVPAAQEAVRQYRYQPTLLNGNPVEVVTDADVHFTLP